MGRSATADFFFGYNLGDGYEYDIEIEDYADDYFDKLLCEHLGIEYPEWYPEPYKPTRKPSESQEDYDQRHNDGYDLWKNGPGMDEYDARTAALKKAKERFGVTFLNYGHCDAEIQYALAITQSHIKAYWETSFDVDDLGFDSNSDALDNLHTALEFMGVSPADIEPKWHIVCSWG